MIRNHLADFNRTTPSRAKMNSLKIASWRNKRSAHDTEVVRSNCTPSIEKGTFTCLFYNIDEIRCKI